MSSQARKAMLLLTGMLAGCSVMDVNLARQQLASGDSAQVAKAEADLTLLSTRGYQDATLALAQWRGSQGDLQGLAQVKAQLQPAELPARDGNAELRYLRWLVPATVWVPDWIPEAEQRLRLRQQQQQDVFELQMKLYAQHPTRLDAKALAPEFKQLNRDQLLSADLWLRAQLRLPVLQESAESGDLQQACAVTPSGEPLLHCFEVQLDWLRRGKSGPVSDIETWKQAVSEEYQQGQLTVVELSSLLDDLVSSRPNGPQLPVATELGRLAIEQPAIALRLYDLLLDQPGQESETAEMERHLQELGKAGEIRAYVLLGRLYTQSPRRTPDLTKAQTFLQQGVADPEGAYWLGRMNLSGQLGEATTERVNRGVTLLITAARGGYRPADNYLAELFATGAGVKRNPVYGYVFSELVLSRSESAGIKRIRAGLTLTPPEQQQAQQLLQQEIHYRSLSAQDGPAMQMTKVAAAENEEQG